jgi:hypothetical protein
MNRKLWILVPLLAVISGIGIAAWRIAGIEKSRAYHMYGSWRGTTNLALNTDDLVTTQVTLFALFALPSQEAVYLFAASDENQKRLNGKHNYIIQGNINNIKAEYWSITAYGRDLYLIPNQANRFSFNRDNLKTDSAGNFKITLSNTPAGDNWLPTPEKNKFELVLRLYHSNEDFIGNLDKATLPTIKRI